MSDQKGKKEFEAISLPNNIKSVLLIP